MKEVIAKLKEILGASFISLLEYKNGLLMQYVLVVKDFKFEDTEALRGVIKKYPVLIFTKEDFVGGVDVFPLDIMLMKHNYLLLAGEDLLEKVIIDKKDLRHHLEYVLRSQRIYLKTQATYQGAKKIVKVVYNTIYPNLVAALYYRMQKFEEGEMLHKALDRKSTRLNSSHRL